MQDSINIGNHQSDLKDDRENVKIFNSNKIEKEEGKENQQQRQFGTIFRNRSTTNTVRSLHTSDNLSEVHEKTKENTFKRRSSKIDILDANSGDMYINSKPLKNIDELTIKPPKLRKRSVALTINNDSGIDGFPSLIQKELHILCKVISIELDGFEQKILIKNIQTDKIYQLKLQSLWSQTKLTVGNKLKIIDPDYETENIICVNSEKGIIIVEPNTLVSSTTLAQALWCRRKAVISERFKNFETNLAMTLGSVCHELFQSAIMRKPKTISEGWLLMEFRNNICSKLLFDLIILNITISEFESNLKPYLKVIAEWLRKHMMSPMGKNETLLDGTIIEDIEDIEINAWSNTVGVKGRIDVALKRKNDGRIIPFELKTGKSTWSMEHEAQVLMYCLLLSERSDGKIPSGMLLYLKDATTKPVIPTLPKLKGIMTTRNGMALYGGHVGINTFPEPLRDVRNCSKCFYANHCTILQKYEDFDEFPSEEMDKFATNKTAHLKENELEYGKKWLKWIFDEWEYDKKQNKSSNIFDVIADERALKGRTLSNMILTDTLKKDFGEYFLTFKKYDSTLILGNIFDVGEVITISTDKYAAIDIGIIIDCQLDSITIKFNKEFSNEFKKEGILFHLDKYESYTTYSIQLNSIINFLEDTIEAKKLREIIIELKLPKTKKLLKTEIDIIKPIVTELSTIQMKAVLKALMSDEYSIIQGFPGSGKTSTIVVLIKCIVALGKSVLLTSYTNTAVDNVMIKLKKYLKDEQLLRIGGNQSTMRLNDMKTLLLDEKMNKIDRTKEGLQEARSMLMKIPVIGTTCLTACNHQFFKWRTKFDYCIVDEAALCLESAILKSLMLANTFTLVGDCLQLSPLVQSEDSQKEGMGISLMEKLEPIANQVGCLTKLNKQYRMNSEICRLSSQLFYDRLLECADEKIANRTIEYENSEVKKIDGFDTKLVELLMSSKIEDSVFFIDTQSREMNGYKQDDSTKKSKSNKGELELIKNICDIYNLMNVPLNNIGVMSTYRSQVEEFCKILPKNIETNTVDQFQGKDKDIILISLVHTSKEDDEMRSGSLLSDRRLNVALTRAKKKLILVGCIESLNHFPLMKKVIEKIGYIYKLNELKKE